MNVPEVSSRIELARFYRDHLERVVLPFWLGEPSDRHNGGVFTCIENESGRRVSDEKFVWSQGRFAWAMGHAARMAQRGVLAGDPQDYLARARETADFLLRHAFLDDGSCAYLLTAEGAKKEFIPGKGHDISYFADCFVILGLTEVARASGEDSYLEHALSTYRGLRSRLEEGTVRSEPYPLPEGCRAHAKPMIMLNVAQELERLLAQRGDHREGELASHALGYMDDILSDFVREDRLVQEVRCQVGGDSLLTAHITPGHAIESMWFVMEEAARHGRGEAVASAVEVVKASFEAGWDREYGGLFRYVVPAQEAGRAEPPSGEAEGPFEQLILDTWDTKIWWPHSETLYAALLGQMLSGDPELGEIHERTRSYTFGTFPHPDPGVGEWIQIRDRTGRPLEKVVGLPVKDPYHLMRNLMVLVELLEEGVEARTTAA